MFLVVVPRALPYRYCSIIILDFGLSVLSVLSSLNVAARAGDDFICAERDAPHAINERNSKRETIERDNDVDTRIAVQIIGRYRAHLSIIIPYSYSYALVTVPIYLLYITITVFTNNMPVHPDLQAERKRASFDPERLTWLMDGGRDRTERRRQLEAVIQRDPSGVFDNTNNAYLHRTDRHVRALAKHVRLMEICRKLNIGQECNGEITQSPDFPLMLGAIADDLPTSLHWVMFLPNIISLCDEDQQKQWLPVSVDRVHSVKIDQSMYDSLGSLIACFDTISYVATGK
jgi:hypothetical protein